MTTTPSEALQELAESLVLQSLLDRVRARWGTFDILDHWQQGEFHHDLVLRIAPTSDLPGSFLVVATNCNGGVKEVLCLAELPARGGLWHARCPDNPEFEGRAPEVLECARTAHWFDPCELLLPDARSELKEEHRERQCGGGWKAR